MQFSANSVANAFLRLSQRDTQPLTNMQLQKLVYIAHGYNLALFDEPLIEDQVKAWQWGPVIPPLYNRLKKYGAGVIDGEVKDAVTIDPASNEGRVIEQVWQSYKGFTGAQLSAITHQEGSPWSATWAVDKFGVIDNSLIAEHYKSLLARNA